AKRAIGDRGGAVAELREAVHLKPDWLAATLDLAWILASTSDSPTEHGEALQLAERGVRLTAKRDPAAFDVLGVALAASGRFDDAIQAAQTALGLGPEASLAADIQTRLRIYRRRERYRTAIQ